VNRVRRAHPRLHPFPFPGARCFKPSERLHFNVAIAQSKHSTVDLPAGDPDTDRVCYREPSTINYSRRHTRGSAPPS
jgi:hypothetical protein